MKEAVLQQKEAIVSEIQEKIENSHSLVIVDYRGLSVSQVTELRNKAREANVDYKVYKNTYARRAFTNLGHEDLIEYLNGPNAIAFAMEDATESAKVISKFAESNDKLEIKIGFLDGKILDPNGVEKLAKIPPKEELIGKAVGSISSPLYNIVGTLNQLTQSPLRDLVYVFEELAKRKENEPAEASETKDVEATSEETNEEAKAPEEETKEAVENTEETNDAE